MEKPTVDIIIPTYKPGKVFEELLNRLERQTYPISGILVMNTQEEFWNKDWEKRYPKLRVHHIEKKEFDHGGTRARAAEDCKSDYMIYMTQDATPADSKLVEEILRPLIEEKAQVSYARQLPAKNCHLIERFTRQFNYPEQPLTKGIEDLPRLGIKTYFCSNVCAAYDRRIYEKMGGFEKSAIFNEDMYYAAALVKKGYRIAYCADARVIHSHNYSCGQQFHRNFDMGVSQACRPDIFQGVSSEGEGIALVKKTAKFLIKERKPWLLAELFFQSAFKYAGYFLGKRYRCFPMWFIKFCTMNRSYWEQKEEN